MATVVALNNSEIARKVDMHPTAISRLRNGERIPSFETIAKVRDAFDLDQDACSSWLLSILLDGAEGSATFLRTIWG